MSRRIAVFALVAGTALMAAPVSADQECFDSTCLAPEISAAPEPVQVPVQAPVQAPIEAVQPLDEVVRAPAEIVRKSDEVTPAKAKVETETFQAPDAIARDVIVTPPPSDDEMAKQIAKEKDMAKEIAKMPVVETPPPAVMARKLPPEPRIYPKSAPEPAVRHAAAPQPQRTVDEQLAPAEAPVRVVGSRRGRGEDMAVPAEVAAQAPARQVYNAPAPAAGYTPSRRAAPNVVVVAPPVTEDGTIVYPAVRPDPNWRLCQIDRRTGQRYYCTAQSYHPYGEGGYRPMGTYRGYATSPGYVTTQPDARIISLDQGD